MTCAQIERAS